jgi:hypothetical protein
VADEQRNRLVDNQIRDLLATTGTSIVLDDADLELALDGVL